MSSNIQVAIRIRPLISREKIEKLKEQWDVNENSMYPIDVTTGKRNGDLYHFDHIFDSSYCNADIYGTVVHPVVDKAMNGFNGTIFAYGQTSSGKTYTMMGNTKEDGLISLAVQNIFRAIEQSENRKFLLRVSYMEIYNEKIYDLLDIKNTVKVSEDYSGSVIVNVKEEITDCAEKVYDIMKKGNKARRIGETDMNEKSSRSHTIFRIIIESTDISDTDVVNVAHLNLVDLAGSERAALTKATGQRLKEGAHINKSLSTLSLVMKQLSESQDFINFRDSKLTRILQPSLGGNALTAIICAVTPAALEETHSTLAFASRAKTVKNKPHLNEVVTDEALINRYALEINKLKKDLELANDKRNLQAQKIAVLENCILFSKKISNSNKNRRKTWSAPCDPNRTLPVIYETDVLRLSDRVDKFDNIELEAFPFKDYPLEADDPVSSSEKKEIPSWTPSFGSESLLTSNESKPSLVEKFEPAKKYEDEIKWLVSSTETPKSVLRERAEYYEHEFKSLKELTTKEKLLTEYNSDMDSLILQLEEVKYELECEKRLRKEQEMKFSVEKKVLETNIDELNKIIQKGKKENEEKNDYEFLVEMYKEKFKKREKELLESLQEARATQNFNINNTDDEKTITSDVLVPVDMKVYLENCKNQLNILKYELESDQQMPVVQKIFDELKTLNEEMLTNCNDCPDELQDLLSEFKCMFDLTSIMLSDDTLIFQLEKDNRHLQNREKTYELLVSKDEELKHLSRNILKYMNERAIHKNEVTKHKEIPKLNSSSSDLSTIMINDTINMTEYDMNSSTLNQSDYTFKTQYTQTEEDFAEIIRLKDKEIEELSDQILDYLDQLTSLEQQLNKLKSTSNAEQSHIECKNQEISELNRKNQDYLSQIFKYEEQISEFKAAINAENTLVKDKEIRELSEKNKELLSKIMDYTNQLSSAEEKFNIYESELKDKNDLVNTNYEEIEKLSSNIMDYINHLHTAEEKVEKYESDLKDKNDLINTMTKEIENLSLTIMDYKNQTSAAEEKFSKYESDLKDQNDLINTKNKEIEKLSFTIKDCENQLSALEEKSKNYESDLKDKNDVINTMTKEIENLSLTIMDYKNQLSALEEKPKNYESDLKDKNDLINTMTKEIENLSLTIMDYKNQLSAAEEKVSKYESDLKDQNDLMNTKNREIEKLSFTIKDCENQLSALEEKSKNYESDLKGKNDLINTLTKEIESLSLTIMDYKNQLSALEEKHKNYESDLKDKNDLIITMTKEIENLSLTIMDYKNQLSAAEEKVSKYESDLKDQNDLMNTKNKEIEKLSSTIANCVIRLAALEGKSKNYESDLKDKNDVINTMTKEIEKLSFTIKDCKNQLSAAEEKSKNYACDLKIKNDVIDQFINQTIAFEDKIFTYNNNTKTFNDQIASKDKEIQELSSKVAKYENQFILTEENIKKYKTVIEEKTNLLELQNKENEDLTAKLDYYEARILNFVEIKKHADCQIQQLQSEKFEFDNKIIQYKEKISRLKSANISEKTISHDLTILQSELTEKEIIISQQDSEINRYKVLNKLLTKQLMELHTNIINMSVNQTRYEEESGQSEEELLLIKFTQISSEFEKLINKLHVEETKSVEYFNRIKILEEQLSQHELALKKYKDYIDQLEAEKIEIQENNTVLSNTNMMEKQEMTLKLQEKSKHIEKLQKELVNYVNNIGQEISKLRKKNEDYKMIVEQVTEKANSKIASYNNIVVKLKQDNELLKAQIKIEKESHRTLLNKVVVLQGELDKKTDELYSGNETAKLQIKVNSLNEQNKKLVQTIEDYQEQVYKKGYEVSAMKKSIEVLEYENTDLHKVNKDLNSRLCETEVLLKSTQTNLQLLEKEREKYNDTLRGVEESLEDVKFELYELKNKERERIKKIKRQSLHDSSRSLSSDEQNTIDENPQTHSKSKTVECETCKVRNRETDESQLSRLQIEYDHMRKKYDQVINLCKIRRNKIDELERQIQSYRTQ